MKVSAYWYNAICVVLLIQCAVPFAGAATLQVGSNLQAAIDSASPGDTLLVALGSYDKVVVTKSLNLIGKGSVVTTSDRDACISIQADGVTISGFTVKYGLYGIQLNNVTGCTISNNNAMHCSQDGIAVIFSNGNLIKNNNASFNGLGGEGWYGIYLSNSNNNQIAGNTAIGNGAYGINLFPSCNNNTIRNNFLQGNMYGLYMFRDCRNNLIESNTMFRNTNSGMDLRFNCHDNKVLNNTVKDNTVAGITLMDSVKNLLRGNDIYGNGRYGIQLQSGSDDNIITSNSITGSQTGIFLDSDGNNVYANRLNDNAIQADDRGKNTWNADYPIGGNMWSDYIGEDKMSGQNQDVPDADKIGDTPYKINGQSVDRYPLMGNQIKQISVLDKAISPSKATVGSNVAIKAKLQSRYGLSEVVVHAIGSKGSAAGGYVRMVQSGGYYQGSMSTALMDPGKYDLVMTVSDLKGHEIKETLGQIDVVPRSGFDSETSKS